MPAPRQAILLAAGEGSRLRPLTDDVPKPLLPIDGRPVIGTLVEQLHDVGVRRLVTVLSPRGEPLRSHLERCAPAETELDFVEQPVALGTADALQRALRACDVAAAAMIAACDTVWRTADVRNLVDEHAAHRPLVTMAARRWPVEQLPHRSCLTIGDGGGVHRVIEKPSTDEVTSALSGSPLYVVEPGFWGYVQAVQPSPHGKKELASALQAAIDDGCAVRAVEVGETRDLTRPNDLLRFNFPYLRDLLPELPLPPA